MKKDFNRTNIFLFSIFILLASLCTYASADENLDLKNEIELLKKRVADIETKMGNQKIVPSRRPRPLSSNRTLMQYVVVDSNISEIPKGSTFCADGTSPFETDLYWNGNTLGLRHGGKGVARLTETGKPINKWFAYLELSKPNLDILKPLKLYSLESIPVDPSTELGRWSDFAFPLRLTNMTAFVVFSEAPAAGKQSETTPKANSK